MSLFKEKIEETKNIGAVMILEVIGKPPEHLIETLENLIKKIDDEPRVSVKGKKISSPELMKNQKDFYTCFAEIEILIEEILDLAILMFKYMPAHVEIVSPELIALTNNGWSDIFSELVRRLHGYDEIARVLTAEKNILEKKLREILEEQKGKEEEKVEKKKKAARKKGKKK